MKNKNRILTMCAYKHGYPTVLITGKWLLAYGFESGAQITVSNPAPGRMLIIVSKTAAEMKKEREELADRVERAISMERRKKAA
jgi:hypothetical protein